MKFEQLVSSYLSLRTVRPPTASTYRYYVRRVTEHTGKESVDDCDLESAIRFRDKLLETSVGVTWNSARRHLIALWKYAESIHIVTHNPWRTLKAAQVPTKPKTILDSEFVKARDFLAANPDRFKPFSFWQNVFLTLGETGMRRAQLVGLIWEDINFPQQTSLLRAQTSKTYREYLIPMSEILTKSLVQLFIEAKALWSGAPAFMQSQAFNLDLHKARSKRERSSLDDERVSRFFTKLARLSDASLSCHRMRHRLATRMMERNATHARNVQALLGHANVATTLNYVSPDIRAIRKAIESLDLLDPE